MTTEEMTVYYPSFDSMRAAHSQLIRQFSLDAPADSESYLEPALEFIRRGQATGALLDSDDERESAQTMLDYWSTRLYRMGKAAPEVLLADFDNQLAPMLPDHLCPYRGLSAFGENDSEIFFGRKKVIDELVERLQASRLVAVVGPSGSGKSSVVRAGLLPTLRKGAVLGSKDWVYLPIVVPGSRPIASLVAALDKALKPAGAAPAETAPAEGRSWQEEEAQPVLAADVAADLTAQGGSASQEPAEAQDETSAYVKDTTRLRKEIEQRFKGDVVLVIDQFEELFTLTDNEFVRLAFVDNLLELVNDPSHNHHVILTMRVDFESNINLLPNLEPVFTANLVRITPLTAADIRQAIEEPARQIGLKFEEGLIDHLLNDILGEPAALPLLQFTLLKLWEHRDRNRITWEDYKRLGGGRQALANSADEFYNSLIPEEQITARRILLRLVRPGEGLEVTSQRMRRLDLYTKGEAIDRIDRVLARFLQARLLRLTRGNTPYDDQIEVAHEALVRNWPTLVSWLETEREAIRQRRRTTIAAERWNELGCTPDLLLRGVELEEALRYDDLNNLETQFIQASQQARADEVEQAQQVAEELRRRNRIITAASIVAGIVAVIAVLLGGFALNRSIAANDARSVAENALVTANEANELALAQAATADAERLRANAQRGTAVAAEAMAVYEKSTAQAANTQIVAQQATKDALSTQSAAQQTQVAEEKARAESQNLVARSRQLADQARSLVSRQTDLGLLLSLESAGLGQSLDEQGILADMLRANPRLRAYLRGHTGAVNDVAYRPDGQMLGSVSADKTLILWPVLADTESVSLTPESSVGPLNSVAFSPNSETVAVGSCSALDRSGNCSTGLLQFYDLKGGQFEFTAMNVHRAEILALTFDRSGLRVATGAADGIIQVWNVPPTNMRVWESNPVYSFTGHFGEVRALAFSPNGRLLVSASEDKTVLVRDLGSASVLAGFIDHKSAVNAVAFSPDGRFLVSGGDDANIFVYDLNRLALVSGPLNRHTYPITGLAFSPDGNTLVSASEDGTLVVWNMTELIKNGSLSSPPNTETLQGHTDAVLDVAFSPDGSQLASASRDNTVIEWYVQAPNLLGTNFIRSTDAVVSLGFNILGNELIVERSNRTLTRWDVTSGLASNGAQWTQTGSPLRFDTRVSRVFYPLDGSLLGLRTNVTESTEVLGVDVSSFNGKVDWNAIEAAGYRFAFTRASEGIDQVDELFEANWAGILDAGMLRGAYHVFRPAQDAVAQAGFFAQTIALQEGDLPPVVVLETMDELPSDQVLQNLLAFLVELQKQTGRSPIVYTNPVFWQGLLEDPTSSVQQSAPSSRTLFPSNDYQLWVASYGKSDAPSLPSGWGTWAFWQYSGEGEVPGIQSQVSLTRFNGNSAALDDLTSTQPDLSADANMESTTLIDLESGDQFGAILPLLNTTSSALHPQGKLLAIGGENGAITFWDIDLGAQTNLVLQYSSAPVNSLAFDSAGRYLASGGADGSVLIWDLDNPSNPPETFAGHSSRVIGLAFSPAGGVLASGSADGSIILWNIETRNAIGQPFEGPKSSVSALAIDPSGNLLAAGHADGSVLLWDISPESWQRKACQLASRNLTQAEWDKYLSGTEYRETCP
jgi:WD40 repeat protein